jgi:alpha-glucosidase
VLAYRRAAAEDQRLVIVNFGESDASVPVQGRAWRVEVSSDGRDEREPYAGVVPGPGAVVLTDAPS